MGRKCLSDNLRMNYDIFSESFWRFYGSNTRKIFWKLKKLKQILKALRLKRVRSYIIEDTFKWRFYRLFGCEHESMKSSAYVICPKCRKSKKKILREKYEKGKMTEEEQTEYILREL